MKNYLSFGGGVNSVAMYLLLLDEGVEFEAVYVWMPDWPETHEYLLMMEEKGYPITVIMPMVRGKGKVFSNLYDYSWEHKMFPVRRPRWCTVKFKINTLNNYFVKPSFIMLGIDKGESHRAALSSVDGIENRYPLIERDLTRNDCIKIIKNHDLSIPIKSGCFICPNQRVTQVKQLRRKHPELFCKLVNLEKRKVEQDIKLGKEPYYTMGKPFTTVVNEPDTFLFDDMAYPPCQCGVVKEITKGLKLLAPCTPAHNFIPFPEKHPRTFNLFHDFDISIVEFIAQGLFSHSRIIFGDG